MILQGRMKGVSKGHRTSKGRDANISCEAAPSFVFQDTMNGAFVLAQSLRDQGVEYMFGVSPLCPIVPLPANSISVQVVGIPVIEVAMAAQAVGIKCESSRPGGVLNLLWCLL